MRRRERRTPGGDAEVCGRTDAAGCEENSGFPKKPRECHFCVLRL